MRHYLIVGNWKMHLGPQEAKQFVSKLNKKVVQHTHVTSVVCPPFLSIPIVSETVEPDIFKVGSQNLYQVDEGTFTGEVSGTMLNECVDYAIIGHSERRKYFHETDKEIAQKVAAAIRNNVQPILCVGENLRERQENLSKRVVNDQLHACLSQITADELPSVVITYEPVWAISHGDGRGQFASPDVVAPMFESIRHSIEEMFGEDASSRVHILYGGSANPDNCSAYLKLEHCDGLLVGGASVNVEQFAAIVKTAQFLSHK